MFSARAASALRALRTALVAMSVVVLSGCSNWFFFPLESHLTTPAEVDIDFQDVSLISADGTRLHAWLLMPDTEPRASVLFLHGNAQNISTHVRAIYWLVKAGYEVLALDYRGYGLSGGEPAFPDVFDDIDAAARWLVDHAGDKPRILLGQSLGASLAIDYLGEHADDAVSFDALVVEAAFTRYGTVAREVASRHWLTWAFQYPTDWLIDDEHDPIDVVASIAPTPLLIIHSQDDRLIDIAHGRRLHEAAGENAVFAVAKGPHITAFADSAMRDTVFEFLHDVLPMQPHRN